MWKLFAGERYGVAVRTTAAGLVGSFTEHLPDYLGFVKYLAYDKRFDAGFPVSAGVLQTPCVHARTGSARGSGASTTQRTGRR